MVGRVTRAATGLLMALRAVATTVVAAHVVVWLKLALAAMQALESAQPIAAAAMVLGLPPVVMVMLPAVPGVLVLVLVLVLELVLEVELVLVLVQAAMLPVAAPYAGAVATPAAGVVRSRT